MLLAFFSSAAVASWSGISLNIEDYSSDWQFQTIERSADINRWEINLEEKTTTDLRVGINIGQMSIRMRDKISMANAQKFEASSLGLYLRLPLMLSTHFSIEGRLSYRFNSGSDSNDIDPSEIEWNEFELELGFSGQWQSVRITPYVAYLNLSGDITNSSSTELFDSSDEISSGIRLDYFIEPTAYVRLQLSIGAREGVYLVFAREY